MTVRSTLRAFVEAGLVYSGVAALGRATRLRRALVLAYHNIVPDDCPPFGDRSLHMSRGQFVRHLERLLTTHVVVPLPEVLTPAAPGQRPRVAITFDDGYRGAVALGVAELVKRGVPATLFVVPGFVGRGPFWWDAVASGAQGGIDPALRARALDELGGQDRDVRRWAETHGRGLKRVPEWALVASETELQAAARHPGITLASHTWSHPNLARLAPAALADELAHPLAWLRDRYASVIPWLSYPYGLASMPVERAAAAAGYAAALGVGGGWFAAAGVNRYAVPRLNVPAGLSANGFVLRTSGLPPSLIPPSAGSGDA
jgi:peptidoglycan/xylan/chitin deacetylase (PgdA/CDA1 family)